jgi:hypothetical protein
MAETDQQVIPYADLFKDEAYGQDEDFRRIVSGYEDMAKRYGVTDQNRQPT